MFTGLAGIGVPLVGLIGSIRLAKPHSLWGRRYSGDKREKALERFKHEEPLASPGARAEPASAGAFQRVIAGHSCSVPSVESVPVASFSD